LSCEPLLDFFYLQHERLRFGYRRPLEDALVQDIRELKVVATCA
jgi:hypothetical protein